MIGAIQLYKQHREYSEGEDSYTDLDHYVKLPEEPKEPKEPSPSPTDETESGGREWPVVDFASLQEINPDIVGWIYIEGTEINYPVVQGRDNQYYLKHLFSGEWNGSGCIFLDSRNRLDFSDRHSIICGHHMKNGSMFAALVEYKDPDYFNAHRTIYLYTPQGVYTATVFSAYVDVATSPQTTISFQDHAAFLSFVETMRNQSITKTDTPIGAEDRIITLSTCTYEYDDARFIVQAVLHPVKTTGE